MERRISVILVGFLTIGLAPQWAHSSVVYSEDFNNPAFLDSVFIPAGEVYAHNDRLGWTDTGIGNIVSTGGWTFESGVFLGLQEGTTDQALWLNQIGPGAMTTVSGLTIGQEYEVRFLQWGDDLTNASFSGTLDVDGSTILSYEYTDKPFGTVDAVTRVAHFTASSSTATLVFGASSGAASPVIDDISISSVPLPPAALLYGSALASLCMLGRRRSNAKRRA